MPNVYPDDAGVLSKNSRDIDITLRITGCFATVTQQKLNVDKTKVRGTTETAFAICEKPRPEWRSNLM